MQEDALLAAVAAEHPGEKVETIETHISWILLAGDNAYKFKRPVQLSFADFTTLDLRRHYCQEELRLNRRLAPELYLEVLPLSQTAAGLRINGQGEPCEYALRMKRFPSQALLTHALAAGRVTPAMFDQLAADLADFHVRCTPARQDDEYGDSAGIAARVRGVWSEVAAFAPQLDRADAVGRLGQWLDERFAALTGQFALRKRQGKVREGHGDLHCGNLVLLDGRIVPFDCIDFNADLRWIDVLSDAAFAVMDLERHGRRDLAFRLLNGYLEHGGDYQGLPVLPYYLVYRALVRAAVAGIRLRQEQCERSPEPAGENLARKQRDIQAYVDLAADYARRSAGFVAITHGPSGSGKTTFARRLVEEFGAIHVRSDVERRRRFSDSASRYSPAATAWTYRRLLELAGVAVRAGFPAIIDATFLSHPPRAEARRFAQILNVPLLILDLKTPRERLFERVAERARERRDFSEATSEVLSRQLQSLQPLRDEETAAAIVVDTQAIEAAERLIAAIRERLPALGDNASE